MVDRTSYPGHAEEFNTALLSLLKEEKKLELTTSA